MKPLLLTLLLLINSCSNYGRNHAPKSNSSKQDWTSLSQTGDLYCDLAQESYEKKGYVHSKCDGVGFTSLMSVRCKYVDLSVFNGPDWKLFRSPTHDCLSNEESKSESSRDMVLMRMLAAYVNGDTEWLNNYYDFVKDNNLSICDSDGSLDGISRCFLSLDLFRLLDELRLTTAKSGFEAHLFVLKTWLKGKAYGAITDGELSDLRELAEREPNNALYQAVYHRFLDGDMSKVHELLSKWPNDRLPNTSDHCEEYLWQRDEVSMKDWSPCIPGSGEVEEHSGTDFNLALYIATESN